MTSVGRYQQVKPVKAVKKPVERKTPLSQPGSKGFNQKTMEKSKAFYSGTGGEY
jgi:hypothetical protein